MPGPGDLDRKCEALAVLRWLPAATASRGLAVSAVHGQPQTSAVMTHQLDSTYACIGGAVRTGDASRCTAQTGAADSNNWEANVRCLQQVMALI